MRSEGYSPWFVCLHLSVTTFSATTRNKAANNWYQLVRHYTGLILNVAIFVKILRSKVMPLEPSEQSNMLMSLSSPALLSHTFEINEARQLLDRQLSVASEADYRGRKPVRGEKINRR